MRILFSFVGGNGHFEPLIPIARASMAAGHPVAFVAQHSMTDAVRDVGFSVFAVGEAPQPPARQPLGALDMEHELRVVREVFAGRIATGRARFCLDLAASWRPDLIVCDEMDMGAMLAAERLGIPYASVVVIAAGGFVCRAGVNQQLDALRVELGLPPDPELKALGRHLVLEPVPPGFRDPGDPLPATARTIRPRVLEEPVPPRRPATDRLTVYFTLGTIFNLESGDLFERALDGLRTLPVNLVVTVGRDIDPAVFGPQPEHVRIERYIPQPEVLAVADLVVSHAGSGTVLGALAYGLPMVLLPIGADQPLNADRCAALGVAQVLDPARATPQAIAEAAAAVLAEPTYRAAARRLQMAALALPGAQEAVRLLEGLARLDRV
ncbi:MAG TPA: glycosyltransferase [Candidatus Limnocylindrales bacterium]|nr:glycosyltransferase [Candidatus Limnocylindrales bacterium]